MKPKRKVIHRTEMFGATLDLGGTPIELSDYATTGLLAVAVGPRGHGKTNAALLIGEQLSAQGWVSVLIDPEGEIESMYGDAVENVDVLRERLTRRSHPIIVVSAEDAEAFIPYGRVILEVADRERAPIYTAIDEGQLFSATKKKWPIGEAANIINQFAERGRKRALDAFITTHRFTGSLNRTIFSNKNVTLVGCQEDPAAWAALAPMFRASRIEYSDVAALGPGEFLCFSRRGVEKIRMPMAAALERVAPKAKPIKKMLPGSFREWDKLMGRIPTDRLKRLTDPVISLLSAVAGLPAQQVLAGNRALQDELDSR